jgi:hypothetical protein
MGHTHALSAAGVFLAAAFLTRGTWIPAILATLTRRHHA